MFTRKTFNWSTTFLTPIFCYRVYLQPTLNRYPMPMEILDQLSSIPSSLPNDLISGSRFFAMPYGILGFITVVDWWRTCRSDFMTWHLPAQISFSDMSHSHCRFVTVRPIRSSFPWLRVLSYWPWSYSSPLLLPLWSQTPIKVQNDEIIFLCLSLMHIFSWTWPCWWYWDG